MKVETTRFGDVEVSDDRITTFPDGLLGLSSDKTYALMQPDNDGVFLWMQSTATPNLAFVVTNPARWHDDYQVRVTPEQFAAIGLNSIDDGLVLTIVNKYDDTLTANMQGPLVINPKTRLGIQVVLCDERWSTREKILDIIDIETAGATR